MTGLLHTLHFRQQEHTSCHVDNNRSPMCSRSSGSTFTQNSCPLHRLFISLAQNKTMRCDLHVHSVASGMFDVPGLSRICRESYNDPTEVYQRLKRLGMSIVTITDHDSIDAVETLRRYPDFFLSEEVTVKMPSGTQMHLGVLWNRGTRSCGNSTPSQRFYRATDVSDRA